MALPKDVIDNIYTKIDSLTTEELDSLPCGAIQLDTEGKILKFNDYESKLAQLSKESVIGKNFFKDIAPCTDVQEFYGRFKEGVRNKQLNVKFRYHFAFKQNPRNVLVNLFYSEMTKTVWVFVQTMD
jgi:photoactive yellow protein